MCFSIKVAGSDLRPRRNFKGDSRYHPSNHLCKTKALQKGFGGRAQSRRLAQSSKEAEYFCVVIHLRQVSAIRPGVNRVAE